MDINELVAESEYKHEMSEALWKIGETLEKLSKIGKDDLKSVAYLKAAQVVYRTSNEYLSDACQVGEKIIANLKV